MYIHFTKLAILWHFLKTRDKLLSFKTKQTTVAPLISNLWLFKEQKNLGVNLATYDFMSLYYYSSYFTFLTFCLSLFVYYVVENLQTTVEPVYSGHLIIADTFSRNGPNHGQTLIEIPL